MPAANESAPQPSRVSLSPLETILQRFESAWRAGDRPALEQFLPDAEGLRRSILVELIHADFELRLKSGEPVRVEDYLLRYPEFSADQEIVCGLIVAEFRTRRRMDASLTAEEYHRRFPDLAPGLLGQLKTLPEPAETVRARPEFPGYEVMEELGHGGMGVVYKARQVGLNRLVALKVIRDEASRSIQARSRLQREAEAVARLAHPNIVHIYEIGRHGESSFFSMEFVAGGSLAQRLAESPLTPPDAAGLVETLARGMHSAHEAGIVHRDLKPANVLLDRRRKSPGSSAGETAQGAFLWEPKITDFGLAKQLGTESGQTRTGDIMGTPAYMAPEQASGRLDAIGPATDVYALGAILYECLTGRPPFRGASVMDTLDQVRTQEPVPPSRLQPACPRDLETICLKCLQKEQGKRYPGALDLAEDCAAFLRGEPIKARPLSRVARGWRWCRRNPTVAALLAAVAVVLVAGTAVSLSLAVLADENARRALAKAEEAERETIRADIEARAARQSAQEARDEKGRADREAEAAKAGKLMAERHLYAAHLNLALRNWEAGHVPEMLDLLARQVPTRPGQEDFRHFEWRYLQRLAHSDLLTIRAHERLIWAPVSLTFSPDGKRVASISDGRAVKVWNAATGKELLVCPGLQREFGITAVAFSPDGKRIAAPQGSQVVLYDADTGRVVLAFSTPPTRGPDVSFSSDGKKLATHHPAAVKVWDAATGKELLSLQPHSNEPERALFSPDGKHLATCGLGPDGKGGVVGEIKVHDAETGKEELVIRGHRYNVSSLAYSPNGRFLASSAGEYPGIVKIWDAAKGTLVRSVEGQTGFFFNLAYSPDGKRIATAGWDQTARIWDVATGQQLLLLRGHTQPASNVAFSPDGRRLATTSYDGTIKIWDAIEPRESLTVGRHPQAAMSLAMSPDGRHAATGGHDWAVRVWDLDDRKEVRVIGGHTNSVLAVAYSPDGRRIASNSRGAIKVWDAGTGKEEMTLPGHPEFTYNLAFSPDGKRLASSGGEQTRPGTVKLWDLEGRKEIFSLGGLPGTTRALAFSRDGGRVAAGSQHWFTPEGQIKPAPVKVWDARTGQELLTLPAHQDEVFGLAFSPDGKQLASASGDKTVKVWDLTDGKLLWTLAGHSSIVFAVTYSPDGRRLASCSADTTVKVWDVVSGQETLTLRGHAFPVSGLAFTPDGHRLATCSGDGVVKVWDATPLDTGRGQ